MRRVRAGSKQLIREINEAIVLAELRARPLSSRTAIAELTGLSLPTVSGITRQLLQDGLIEERATGDSAGGRRPILLALRPAAGHVVGIKLTENRLVAVLTDLDAAVVARHSIHLTSASLKRVVEAVSSAVAALDSMAPSRVYGVGVGLAGVIDREQGLVRHGTYSDWHEVDLGARLEEALGLPVIIDNDVNALAASEQWFGAGRNRRNFLVVSIGRGIGLGVVLDGNVFRGSRGGAGELGHVKVKNAGPMCPCGGRGCLESVAAEPALVSELAARMGTGATIDEAVERAAAGDQAVARVFARAGRHIGVAVANVVNVLNPELVVIAGEGTRAGEVLLRPLREALLHGTVDSLREGLSIEVGPRGDEAWARGAASLFLGELFQPNLRSDESQRPFLTARPAG